MVTNKIAVCALIKQGDQDLYLGISRRDNRSVFGLPGGKVEPLETLEDALVRELQEETSLLARKVEKIFFSIDEEGWHCTTFLVKQYDGSPQSSEEGDVKWCTWQELFDGPFGAYNKALHACLPRPFNGLDF